MFFFHEKPKNIYLLKFKSKWQHKKKKNVFVGLIPSFLFLQRMKDPPRSLPKVTGAGGLDIKYTPNCFVS